MDIITQAFKNLSLYENTIVNVPINAKGAVIGRHGRTIKVNFFKKTC